VIKKFNFTVSIGSILLITLFTQSVHAEPKELSKESGKTVTCNKNHNIILEGLKTSMPFKFISYKIFLKEFIYTNSLADYHRSIKRIETRYNLKILGAGLFDLNSLKLNFKSDIISKKVIKLSEEAHKHAEFKSNKYHDMLEKIISLTDNLLTASIIELKIVDELRKFSGKATLSKEQNTGYVRYLLNNARYQIFLYVINCR
jgi:hypothetical protein